MFPRRPVIRPDPGENDPVSLSLEVVQMDVRLLPGPLDPDQFALRYGRGARNGDAVQPGGGWSIEDSDYGVGPRVPRHPGHRYRILEGG